MIADWKPIDRDSPKGRCLLLWWIGIFDPHFGGNPPQGACNIGIISTYESNKVWSEGNYIPIEAYSHWAELPEGPIKES